MVQLFAFIAVLGAINLSLCESVIWGPLDMVYPLHSKTKL